jgi:hypothetical protein
MHMKNTRNSDIIRGYKDDWDCRQASDYKVSDSEALSLELNPTVQVNKASP